MIINREQLNKFLIEELTDITNKNYIESGHFEEPLDIDWDMYLSIGDVFEYPYSCEGRIINQFLIFDLI